MPQDFRNCEDGVPIVDSFSAIAATANGGVECSDEGISLDGNDGSFVSLDAWNWAGVASFELLVLADNAANGARIVELAKSSGKDIRLEFGISAESAFPHFGFALGNLATPSYYLFIRMADFRHACLP